MNKARRNELKQLHYKRRLKQLGLKDDPSYYAYKSSGKPCSCYLCSPYKYNRAKEKQEIQETILVKTTKWFVLHS